MPCLRTNEYLNCKPCSKQHARAMASHLGKRVNSYTIEFKVEIIKWHKKKGRELQSNIKAVWS